MVSPSWEPSPEDSGFSRREVKPVPGSLDEFYLSPARKSSAEVELGDAWTSGGDPDATYAVRWIEATGEVYALRLVEPLDGRFRVWLYWFTGALMPNWRKNDRPEVTVVGVCASRSDLDTRLRGWQDKMHELGSLEWLKERLGT